VAQAIADFTRFDRHSASCIFDGVRLTVSQRDVFSRTGIF
jgi:hypothetical protein